MKVKKFRRIEISVAQFDNEILSFLYCTFQAGSNSSRNLICGSLLLKLMPNIPKSSARQTLARGEITESAVKMKIEAFAIFCLAHSLAIKNSRAMSCKLLNKSAFARPGLASGCGDSPVVALSDDTEGYRSLSCKIYLTT